jgi:hypothetical protein
LSDIHFIHFYIVIFLYFSLQTIAQDVKETQEDVDQLDERVARPEIKPTVFYTLGECTILWQSLV